MSGNKDVGRMIKILSHEFDRYVLSCGVEEVTGLQGRIIGYIHDHMAEQDIFQRDIEARFNIRRSTVTGILQKMEKNGLIMRMSVASDARLKRLVLTEKAEEIFDEIRHSLEAAEGRIIEGISDTEVCMFIKTAEKMLENLCSRPEQKGRDV